MFLPIWGDVGGKILFCSIINNNNNKFFLSQLFVLCGLQYEATSSLIYLFEIYSYLNRTENEPKKRSGLLTRKEKLAKKKARRQQVDDNYEEQERLLASSATAMSNTSGYTKVVYSVDDNTVKEKSAVVGADEKKSAAL